MHRKRPLSEVHEMYLKTLLRVRGDRPVARVRDLADGLGVTPGTVSSVVKKLDRMRLVEHDRYGFVTLTSRGQDVAACVERRFETLRDVLVEVLGVDAATAEADACAMEHAVSPVTVNRFRALLERARAGKAAPRGPAPRTSPSDPCAGCEAHGACRAGATA